MGQNFGTKDLWMGQNFNNSVCEWVVFWSKSFFFNLIKFGHLRDLSSAVASLFAKMPCLLSFPCLQHVCTVYVAFKKAACALNAFPIAENWRD